MSDDTLEPSSTPSPKIPRLASKPSTRRTFQKIPIFIVDYHNEVLDLIYRCFATRHLPLTENTLIHFDSHPDMVISRHIKPETVFNKDDLLSKLSIENWIMPGCYAGHFSQLLWIKNSYCDQMPEGTHHFRIGSSGDEIRVDLPIDYFVSEANYCETDALENVKEIRLQVISADKITDDLQLQTMDANQETGLILDIDLDFFSVTNPFLDIYKKANLYNDLQRIFSYDESGDPEVVADYRRKQLEELEKVFLHLDSHRSLDGFANETISSDRFEMITSIVRNVVGNYTDDEIDWILINDAGQTSDHNGLPHHISTDEELEKYYRSFEDFLRRLKRAPDVITMARSTEDNYCPKDQVDGIQARVLEILRNVYDERLSLKPILAYQEEEWDVMKL